eukprot:PhM_4_TR18686/c0_g1_i1/m.46319
MFKLSRKFRCASACPMGVLSMLTKPAIDRRITSISTDPAKELAKCLNPSMIKTLDSLGGVQAVVKAHPNLFKLSEDNKSYSVVLPQSVLLDVRKSIDAAVVELSKRPTPSDVYAKVNKTTRATMMAQRCAKFPDFLTKCMPHLTEICEDGTVRWIGPAAAADVAMKNIVMQPNTKTITTTATTTTTASIPQPSQVALHTLEEIETLAAQVHALVPTNKEVDLDSIVRMLPDTKFPKGFGRKVMKHVSARVKIVITLDNGHYYVRRKEDAVENIVRVEASGESAGGVAAALRSNADALHLTTLELVLLLQSVLPEDGSEVNLEVALGQLTEWTGFFGKLVGRRLRGYTNEHITVRHDADTSTFFVKRNTASQGDAAGTADDDAIDPKKKKEVDKTAEAKPATATNVLDELCAVVPSFWVTKDFVADALPEEMSSLGVRLTFMKTILKYRDYFELGLSVRERREARIDDSTVPFEVWVRRRGTKADAIMPSDQADRLHKHLQISPLFLTKIAMAMSSRPMTLTQVAMRFPPKLREELNSRRATLRDIVQKHPEVFDVHSQGFAIADSLVVSSKLGLDVDNNKTDKDKTESNPDDSVMKLAAIVKSLSVTAGGCPLDDIQYALTSDEKKLFGDIREKVFAFPEVFDVSEDCQMVSVLDDVLTLSKTTTSSVVDDISDGYVAPTDEELECRAQQYLEAAAREAANPSPQTPTPLITPGAGGSDEAGLEPLSPSETAQLIHAMELHTYQNRERKLKERLRASDASNKFTDPIEFAQHVVSVLPANGELSWTHILTLLDPAALGVVPSPLQRFLRRFPALFEMRVARNKEVYLQRPKDQQGVAPSRHVSRYRGTGDGDDDDGENEMHATEFPFPLPEKTNEIGRVLAFCIPPFTLVPVDGFTMRVPLRLRPLCTKTFEPYATWLTVLELSHQKGRKYITRNMNMEIPPHPADSVEERALVTAIVRALPANGNPRRFLEVLDKVDPSVMNAVPNVDVQLLERFSAYIRIEPFGDTYKLRRSFRLTTMGHMKRNWYLVVRALQEIENLPEGDVLLLVRFYELLPEEITEEVRKNELRDILEESVFVKLHANTNNMIVISARYGNKRSKTREELIDDVIGCMPEPFFEGKPVLVTDVATRLPDLLLRTIRSEYNGLSRFFASSPGRFVIEDAKTTTNEAQIRMV